jgi:uncharacterized membrane protein
MDEDVAPMSRPDGPKTAVAPPNDAELSRIAREAVHQPADPRLDRQLARMIGVMEPSEPADTRPAQPTARLSVVSGADLERLHARLRRIEMVLGALILVVGILAISVVILLSR